MTARDDIESGEVWPPEGDDSEGDVKYAYGQPEALIHYVMDLEDLVRWFALLFRADYFDPITEKMVSSINDPIWTVWDDKGNYLAAAAKLQETWDRVMHPDGRPTKVADL